jgi:ABC-2 type transport system permease protein
VPVRDVLATEVTVGTLLTLPSLVVVALVGRFLNGVQLDAVAWMSLVGVLWLGSTTFVALGLLIGLSLDEKAAGGAIGIVGVVLAALGGLWIPVQVFPEALQTVALAMPSYWYAELGRAVVAGAAPQPATVLAMGAFTVAFTLLASLVVRRRPLHAVSG